MMKKYCNHIKKKRINVSKKSILLILILSFCCNNIATTPEKPIIEPEQQVLATQKLMSGYIKQLLEIVPQIISLPKVQNIIKQALQNSSQKVLQSILHKIPKLLLEIQKQAKIIQHGLNFQTSIIQEHIKTISPNDAKICNKKILIELDKLINAPAETEAELFRTEITKSITIIEDMLGFYLNEKLDDPKTDSKPTQASQSQILLTQNAISNIFVQIFKSIENIVLSKQIQETVKQILQVLQKNSPKQFELILDKFAKLEQRTHKDVSIFLEQLEALIPNKLTEEQIDNLTVLLTYINNELEQLT